jgi:glutamate-1-semialdehyde 2,1-aminomutase
MTSEYIELDLGRIEEIIGNEEAALVEKQPRSISHQKEASGRLPGGVSSSWQTSPPHPIYLERGKGSTVWDIDGNAFVDYHGGYGVMVVGHAHPKIVEAVQRRIELGSHFAQPTEDALIVADNLAERTGLPMWRFGNSGTETTLDATRIMRRGDGPRPAPEGRGHLPRPPRRADGVGVPERGRDGAA